MHLLSATWWRLFINRTDGTLRQQGSGWYFDPRELSLGEVSAALDGRQSLGVYATDQAGLARWICWDVDDDAGREALIGLAQTLDPLSRLFEYSRRGAHLWLFCPATPWNVARSVGLSLATQVGLECEVFPKSAGRTGVRLPLTPHPKTGERYPVLDPESGEILSVDALRSLTTTQLPQVELAPVRVPAPRDYVDGPERFRQLVGEIERLTRLRIYGPERAIGRCPFHDDRHPSLSVLGGFWRCWAGCGEGGIGAFRAQVQQRGD